MGQAEKRRRCGQEGNAQGPRNPEVTGALQGKRLVSGSGANTASKLAR
jgi:hypothetical protein